MEAVYFGNIKVWGFGSGNGPWIMGDLENGLYSGSNAGLNSDDPTTNYRFTTAMVEGGSANQWAILGGNAQSGGLATDFSGTRPCGYYPMKKQGAIILGTGGDNSDGADGTWYEGVMTSGEPSAATEAAVQANIVAAGYAARQQAAAGRPARSRRAPTAPSASTTAPAPPPTATRSRCGTAPAAPNQQWTVESNGTLQVYGKCMDITGANYRNGTLVELWDCNGGGNQQWQARTGSWSTPPPASASTTPTSTPPTAPSSSCGPATAAPTSNGTCPS